MFAVGIAIVCFYHAERVLSGIVKFLLYLLREGEKRGEMGKGRGRGREWRKNREGMEGEMGMHENSPKTQQIWHLGTPLRGYRLVSYF